MKSKTTMATLRIAALLSIFLSVNEINYLRLYQFGLVYDLLTLVHIVFYMVLGVSFWLLSRD